MWALPHTNHEPAGSEIDTNETPAVVPVNDVPDAEAEMISPTIPDDALDPSVTPVNGNVVAAPICPDALIVAMRVVAPVRVERVVVPARVAPDDCAVTTLVPPTESADDVVPLISDSLPSSFPVNR